MHQVVCGRLQEQDKSLQIAVISNRTFLSLNGNDLETTIWVVVVPPKYRLTTYLKILKLSFLKKRAIILSETPASFVDLLFSILPFVTLWIAEAANVDIVITAPKVLERGFSYSDKRFGPDHSYAVYFRFMGVLGGILHLMKRNICLMSKKDDQQGIEVIKGDEVQTSLLSADQRIENELAMLTHIYQGLLKRQSPHPVTKPLSNFLLKKIFLSLTKKDKGP